MLDEILEDQSVTNLLGFFIANPNRAFYAADLQRKVGRSVDRVLPILVKLDFLNVSIKKNSRYYMLNSRAHGLAEIKSKVAKASKRFAEDDLTKAIRQMPKIKVGVLCGIFCGNPELAVDVLLVGEISKKRLDNFVALAEKAVGQEVNFALFETDEYQTRRNMFDRFIKDIYENPHYIVVNKLK